MQDATPQLPPPAAETEAILPHLRKLHSDRLKQALSLPDFTEVEQPPWVFAELVRSVSEPGETYWHDRLAAAWGLGHTPLAPEQKREASEALCRVLDGSERTRAGRIGERGGRAMLLAFMWGTVAFVTLIVSGMFIDVLVEAPGGLLASLPLFVNTTLSVVAGLWIVCLVLALLGTPLVLPISYALDGRRHTAIQVEAVKSLGRLAVPESVSALAAFAHPHREHWPNVTRALRAVLPGLTTDHYGRLRGDTVPNLCRILRLVHERGYAAEHGAAFPLELLTALKRIGDGRAVETVRAVAEEGHPAAVCGVARRVLPVLEARREQAAHASTLLRGSAPNAQPDELLRAASAEATTPPERLLRAATGAADTTAS